MAIQSQAITQYTTSDGKTFLNLHEAEIHEAEIKNETLIEAYLKKEVPSERTQNMIRRHLAGLLAFQETFEKADEAGTDLEEPVDEEPVDEEPADEENAELNMSLESEE